MIEKGKQIFFFSLWILKEKKALDSDIFKFNDQKCLFKFSFLFCFVLNFAKNGNNPGERKLILKSWLQWKMDYPSLAKRGYTRVKTTCSYCFNLYKVDENLRDLGKSVREFQFKQPTLELPSYFQFGSGASLITVNETKAKTNQSQKS